MKTEHGSIALIAIVAALFLVLPATARAAPTRPVFDHLTTGFELTGAHRITPCESCHVDAIFRGTPSRCESCHVIGSRISTTSKSATHVVSSDDCAQCHTTSTWALSGRYDHSDIRGSCASCHNGVQAEGKNPGHVETTQDCDACHRTTAWIPAGFDH
ncbi:MAG: cytochrome c3 family protein, partial [Steroidobacteraceae bacterium]